MLFNTWLFAVFGVTALTVYWFLPPRFRQVALIALGIAFYAAAGVRYLLLVVVLTIVTFLFAKSVLHIRARPRQREIALVLSIVLLVGVLVFFKYVHWLVQSLNLVLPRADLAFPALVVPLAISFFTFEFIHVLVDAQAKRITHFNFFDFAAFALFFPTMVAGPIKRYQRFAPQLADLKNPSSPIVLYALLRIAAGLFKKIVLADSLTTFVQPLLHPSGLYSGFNYAVATFAFTWKVFFDFSGYCDVAIGFAVLLGLVVPENFASPYSAPNIGEFWRRWHISLSSWVRDYIFVPLGGSRKSGLWTAANLTIVMLAIGLWHGAGWHFVMWGIWNGASLGLCRAWQTVVVPRVQWLKQNGLFVRPLSVGFTYVTFALGLVLFAAPSVTDATTAYISMAKLVLP